MHTNTHTCTRSHKKETCSLLRIQNVYVCAFAIDAHMHLHINICRTESRERERETWDNGIKKARGDGERKKETHKLHTRYTVRVSAVTRQTYRTGIGAGDSMAKAVACFWRQRQRQTEEAGAEEIIAV